MLQLLDAVDPVFLAGLGRGKAVLSSIAKGAVADAHVVALNAPFLQHGGENGGVKFKNIACSECR